MKTPVVELKMGAATAPPSMVALTEPALTPVPKSPSLMTARRVPRGGMIWPSPGSSCPAKGAKWSCVASGLKSKSWVTSAPETKMKGFSWFKKRGLAKTW